MKMEITTLDLDNEMDIVLAHRRAMQISKFAGINISDQTRFATAVSEICRNAVEFCQAGTIGFSIIQCADRSYDLEAIVSDCGEGIADLQGILLRNPQTHVGKGRGIVFSKKLVDNFKISTGKKGTTVNMLMHIPANNVPINKLIVQGWVNHIKKEPVLSAYEELKIRNAGLMQLTDQLKLEQEKTDAQLIEIQELNERLRDTNSYLEEFTYTVSHDLKTPLTTLNLSLRFLEEAEDQDAKITYIGIIERAARRLEKTVQGLVEILDVQTKQQSIVKKVSLEDLFEDTREEFAQLPSSGDIVFEHSFMVPEIVYVPPYLTSIFTNLIGNSIKYRQAGKPLTISVSSRRKAGMVLLTFTDNGEGIDLNKHGARMFTPFSRFNTVIEGKGIGLYLIRKMIEKNGGKIHVESTPGEGTSFFIQLKEYSMPQI